LPQRERQFQADWQKLLSFDGETALRAGVAVDYEHYTYGVPLPVSAGDLRPPAAYPRTLAGIGPIVSLHQDRYASFENLREVARAEDYNLGWDVSTQALWDSTALGASANGPEVSVTASKGFEPFPQWVVLADGSLMARRDGRRWRNEALTADATAYGQPWRRCRCWACRCRARSWRSTACARWFRCRAAFRSARSPSAVRARSMPRCS